MATKLSLVPPFLRELADWLEAERVVIVKRERGRRVLAERLAAELPPFADRDGFAGSATDLYQWLASQRHLFALPDKDRALHAALRERMLPRLPSPAAQCRADEVLSLLHQITRIPRRVLDEHRLTIAQNLDYEARPDWVDVDAEAHARGFCAFVPADVLPPSLVVRALAPVLEAQRTGTGEPSIREAQESLYEWDMSWDPVTQRWEGCAQVSLEGLREPVLVELSLAGEPDGVPDVRGVRAVLSRIDECFAHLCIASSLDRRETLLRLHRLQLSLDGDSWDLHVAVDDLPLFDAGE